MKEKLLYKKDEVGYEVSNGKNATPFGKIAWISGMSGCYLKENKEILNVKKLKQIIEVMEEIDKENGK
jgi:hypothetical protein